MDIANSLATSVLPAPFHVGVEEAKRDTQARQTIPAPKQSASSASQGQIKDEHGNTEGENSNLATQTKALLSTPKDNKRQPVSSLNNNQQDPKQATNPQDNKEAQTQKLTKEDLRANFAKLMQSQNTNSSELSNKVASTLQGFFSKETLEGKAERTKEKIEFAKFDEKALRKNSDGKESKEVTINRAISRRYNSIVPSNNLGTSLDLAI